MRFLCLLIGFSVLALARGVGPSHEKIVVCLAYTNKVIDGFKSTKIAKLEDIDLSLCTHLYAVHSNFDPDQELWKSTTKEDEEEYKQLKNLKSKYPHLKISLIMASRDLTKYINTPDKYDEIIEKTTDFILSHGFDGLDISFEYDSGNPLPPSDFDRIVPRVKSLSENFHRSNLSLSSTFIYVEGMTDAYNYPALSNYVDFISFAQTFFDSKQDTLKFLNIFNVKQRINGLISRGVPSTKILVDVNFMGYKFGKQISEEFGNLMRYNEICKLASTNDQSKWVKSYDSDWGLAYLKNKDRNEDIDEIVYESTRSLANRAQLAVKMNLGGVLTSSVNMDDFRGECDVEKDTFDDFEAENNQTLYIPKGNDTTFSLLQTISDALYIAQCKIPPGKGGSKFVCGLQCQIFIICGILAIVAIIILVFQSRHSYSFLGQRSRLCCCCSK